MAAHLTGQRGAGLLHLGLDEAVTGLPHQWLTAQFFDSIEKRLARLNVGDDRGPRHFFQHRFGEDGEEMIAPDDASLRSEEHTSELQSLMRISYAVFCLKKQKNIS